MFLFQYLTFHEQEQLITALRRDMRRQADLASSNTNLADWHGFNVRTVTRILECINPKSPPYQPAIAEVTCTEGTEPLCTLCLRPI
jgi:hypothetical protein